MAHNSFRELYAVDIEFQSWSEAQEWEDAMKRAEDHGTPVPPIPERKTDTIHVAVAPGWAGDPVARASAIAVETRVGPPDCWDDFQPTVTGVRLLGGVAVEEVEVTPGIIPPPPDSGN